MEKLLYLSANEVAEIGPTMAECIDALEVAFEDSPSSPEQCVRIRRP